MMHSNKTSQISPTVRTAGLIVLMTAYIMLSSFSIYESMHLIMVIPNKILAKHTILAFGVCILVPIHLAHIRNLSDIAIAKLFIEALPFFILGFLLHHSLEHVPSNLALATYVATFFSELTSLVILFFYTRILRMKPKSRRKVRSNNLKR